MTLLSISLNVYLYFEMNSVRLKFELQPNFLNKSDLIYCFEKLQFSIET